MKSGGNMKKSTPSNGAKVKSSIGRTNSDKKLKSVNSSSSLSNSASTSTTNKRKGGQRSMLMTVIYVFIGSLFILMFVLVKRLHSHDSQQSPPHMNNIQSLPNLRNSNTIPTLPQVSLPPAGQSHSHPSSAVVITDLNHNDINQRCPKRLQLELKQPEASQMHFIHIPKCGGTSMTAVLRELACALDPQKNVDCCTNPGFCDWHAKRRCEVIKGCTNHYPQTKYIYKPMPSITLFRHPLGRILSAWFYRGHSPNLDFFSVRPEFKDIQLGKRPKVKFDEYIEMVEYQNIMTRMLGADSFPYRNITITEEVFCKAVEVLDNIFFIGIQEAYDISVHALIREYTGEQAAEVMKHISIRNEREQSNGQISSQKKAIRDDTAMVKRFEELNRYDYELYHIAVQKFCIMIKKYDDLYKEIQKEGKVKCD